MAVWGDFTNSREKKKKKKQKAKKKKKVYIYIYISLLSLAYVNHVQNILLKYQMSESQAGVKVAGRNIKTLRYIDGNMETNRKWKGNKEAFHEGEREEWKSVLKTLRS